MSAESGRPARASELTIGDLIRERDYLLDGLDDIERDRAAGELDDVDYVRIRDDYVVRIAELDRRVRSGVSDPAAADHPASRRWLWVGGIVAFAVVAGWFLARAVGERGVGDQLTGSGTETPREQVLRCQQLGQDPSTLLDSFECFDEVLVKDPGNVEALAYRGWYGVLAAGSAQRAGEDELASELIAGSGPYLDRAIEVDPTYPDARAFRMIVYERLGQQERACDDYRELVSVDPPQFVLGLVDPVAERLGCEGTR